MNREQEIKKVQRAIQLNSLQSRIIDEILKIKKIYRNRELTVTESNRLWKLEGIRNKVIRKSNLIISY